MLLWDGRPTAWIAQHWTTEDAALLKAEIGDAAWQAEWELFAVLIAIDTWLSILRLEHLCLVQSDATAALHSAHRSAGRTPIMNALSVEIALRMESAMVHMDLEHYRGSINFECDALSRLAQGAEIPSRLLDIPQTLLQPRSLSFFWGWPKTLGTEKLSVVATGQCAKVKRGTPSRR